MADSYQGEIVNSLRQAGYRTRSPLTIPPEKMRQYYERGTEPKKSEADLFVIKGRWGGFIEIKTAKDEVLSYGSGFQKGQWDWAIKHQLDGFHVFYAIMFTGLTFPNKHPKKLIRRDLLLLPFSLLVQHREKVRDLGGPDELRYNNRPGISRVFQDHLLTATDLFPGFFLNWENGRWMFPSRLDLLGDTYHG